MQRPTCAIAAPIAIALLTASVFAGPPRFTITVLALEGDDVARIGAITAIDAVSVNDSGEWLVEVDTNFANTDFDAAVLRNGLVFLREGDPIGRTGFALDSFDSVWLNDDGNVGWNLFLDNLPTGEDSGLFYNDELVLQEGFISNAAGFSGGTPYIGFFETRLNDADSMFVIASVDDPAIASSVDRGLVRIDEAPGPGTITETVLAKEADVLPGVADAVLDFGTGPENFAINDVGSMFYSAALTGAVATNGGLWLYEEGVGHTLVARKGDESPVAGRTYSNIGGSTRLDLNDKNDTVFVSNLSGDAATNTLVVRNGAKFVQKGDPAPGTAGLLINGFNTSAIRIDSNSEVVWYADLSGDAAQNQALYRENEILVRKGVTMIDGLPVTTISGTTATGGISESISISRNGQFIAFRGVLNNDLVGAFLISFDAGASADLNGDSVVDGADYGILLAAWGPCVDCPSTPCDADLNGDCTVDGGDLGILLAQWT